MIDPLGQRTVTLLRYPPSTYGGDGRMAVGTPASSEVTITVNPAPRGVSVTNGEGKRLEADIVAVGYVEVLAGDDLTDTPPDRLVMDGATYEVRASTRSAPFEDQPESWYLAAIRVQPYTFEAAALVAPSNVIPPSILGTGDVLTAWVGLWDGSLPLSYALSWLLDNVEISTSSSVARPDSGTLVLEVTATNSEGSATAESQPLGSGGGPVDCEIECAETIAAAVAAAVAPLEAEIAQLEIDLAEAIAERDALQALYDAALITIAERDATIVILNATIATLTGQLATANATITSLTAQLATANAAILRSKGWVNYCTLTPDATAQATVDTGTGLATLAYVGSGGVDPGDAPCRVSWRLQQADGTAASGYPYGPYLLEIVGTPTVGGLPEIAIVLTDSAAVEATGSYAVWCGQYMTTATSRRIVYGARIAGAAWTRTLGGVGSATDGPCLWTHQPAASSLGTGGSRLTGSNLFADLTANNTNSAISQQLAGWGTTNALYLHLVVFGGTSFSGTVRVWAPPIAIPRTPA